MYIPKIAVVSSRQQCRQESPAAIARRTWCNRSECLQTAVSSARLFNIHLFWRRCLRTSRVAERKQYNVIRSLKFSGKRLTKYCCVCIALSLKVPKIRRLKALKIAVFDDSAVASRLHFPRNSGPSRPNQNAVCLSYASYPAEKHRTFFTAMAFLTGRCWKCVKRSQIINDNIKPPFRLRKGQGMRTGRINRNRRGIWSA